MQRYYIPQTSWFDSHIYDTDKIKAVLRESGAKNIRTCYQWGWNNQPRVVSFSLNDPEYRHMIDAALCAAFNTDWIHVYKKDW